MYKWQTLLLVQIGFGLVYVFLSCYEFLNSSYRALIPVNRYIYTPYIFYTRSFLKIGFFVSVSIMLLTSQTRMFYLYPICLIIAITEGIVLLLRLKRKLLFINMYANYLLISLFTIQKIFASEIEKVEFRHEIFFIVLKNGKSKSIKLMNIHDKKAFVANFAKWLVQNKVSTGDNLTLKMNEFASNI